MGTVDRVDVASTTEIDFVSGRHQLASLPCIASSESTADGIRTDMCVTAKQSRGKHREIATLLVSNRKRACGTIMKRRIISDRFLLPRSPVARTSHECLMPPLDGCIFREKSMERRSVASLLIQPPTYPASPKRLLTSLHRLSVQLFTLFPRI